MMGAVGTALAQSKCDAGTVKAKAKDVSCECRAIAKAITKGGPPAVTKCVVKFGAACRKAQSAGDCVVQTKSCDDDHGEVYEFVMDHCLGSPSGAFLN